jgi:hypothetical protein
VWVHYPEDCIDGQLPDPLNLEISVAVVFR